MFVWMLLLLAVGLLKFEVSPTTTTTTTQPRSTPDISTQHNTVTTCMTNGGCSSAPTHTNGLTTEITNVRDPLNEIDKEQTTASTGKQIITTEAIRTVVSTDNQLSTTTQKVRNIKEIDIDYYYDSGAYIDQSIDEALNSENVTNYIANLTSDFQRYLVRENLRHCPFMSLCYISLGLDYRALFYDPSSSFASSRIPCCLQCSCDPECVDEGLCCPDVPWLFRSDGVDDVDAPYVVQEECVQRGIPDNGNNLNDRIERFKVIARCPLDTNEALFAKCVQNYDMESVKLSLTDVVFVFDNTTGKTYRNKYCALCNGVEKQFMLLWQPELSCQLSALDFSYSFSSTSEILPRVLSGMTSCDIIFRIPELLESQIIPCSKYIARCNQTGLWREYNSSIDRACSIYGAPIEINSTNGDRVLFRNPFCVLCNGLTPSSEEECKYSTNYEEHYTFSGLLRIEDDEQQRDDDVELNCPPDSVYDTIKKKCRQIHCTDGREYVNGKCLTITDIRHYFDYELTLRVQPMSDVYTHEAYLVVSELEKELSKVINAINPNITTQCSPTLYLMGSVFEKDQTHTVISLNESKLHFYEMQYLFTVSDKHNSTFLIETLLSLNDTYMIYETGSVSLSNNIDEQKVSEMLIFHLKITHTDRIMFDKVTDLQLNLSNLLHLENLPDLFNYAIEHVQALETNAYFMPFLQLKPAHKICHRYRTSRNILNLRGCPMFKIPWTDFKWNTAFNGIEVENSGVKLDVSEYGSFFDNDLNSTFILVCVELYKERFRSLATRLGNEVDTVGFLVSVICISISIASLLVSLCTYCFLKQLRNVPGKNNMALIVFLLLAQGMYLVGNFGGFHSGTMACKVIGVATHFCWLLALFWMQLCTFHMFTVLGQMRTPSMGNKRFWLYHAYCLTCAVVFVGINMVFSLVTSDYSEIGYGARTCYISTQMMIELTFGIPAALVVLGNIIMFLTIVIKLKRAPSVQKNVKNERNYFLIFAKLSTVTGMAWVFGFVYMWTGIEIFMYVFTVLNAGQGVFIMLGFVCNKRNVTLYKEQFTKQRSEQMSVQTVSTTN